GGNDLASRRPAQSEGTGRIDHRSTGARAMGVTPNDTGHRLQGQLLRRFLARSPFRRVAERAHIDFAGNWWRGVEELVFRALRICADCPQKALCRSWLDEEHSQET